MAIVRRTSNGFPTLARFFDDDFHKDFFTWANKNFSNTGTSIPAVNIKENDEAFVLEVAAPGMDKSDFKVHVDNNLLTISSEKAEKHTEETGDKYTRREFSYQSFSRSFTLPESVESNNIEAKYVDGVLNIALPKKEEAKKLAPRNIEIS